MNLNDTTFLISVFFLPLWLVWELTLLWLRNRGIVTDGHLVGTISMVMRDRAYQLNCIPFFWAGMSAHWWVNWLRTRVWDVPYPAVAYWLLVVCTLGVDIWLFHTPYSTLPDWAKVIRSPMVQVGLGFIAAYFLFPQQANNAPGWRWW